MGVAFFDMDKTLLDASSGILFVKYLWKNRAVSLGEMIRVFITSAEYTLNRMDFPRAMARMSSAIRGGNAASLKALCDRWFEDELKAHIAVRAVARARAHQQQGESVVLLSASTQFAVRPVAEHLGLEYGSTELAIEDGALTGGLVGEACYGEGKLIWGRRIAERHGCALDDCAFYTDSASDLPLIEAVGRPVAVNPDAKLKALARKNGWPIETFY